jgi:hypothetical protein
MDEVGRRWDAADRDRRGLTYDDINRTYGTTGSGGGGIGGPDSPLPSGKTMKQ